MGKGVKEFLQKQLVQFGHFIYNPKTKEIFGRTRLSWFQILAYLTLLYIFLAGLLAAHIFLFIAVTPAPAPDVRPWNFGRYAYPNYPNAKIAMISLPSTIKSNQPLSSETLRQIRILTNDQNITCGKSQDNMNCVFIYIARTFDWKPELIDSDIGDYLSITCTVDKNVTYDIGYSLNGGIPLNIPNNVDSIGRSRSFPYRRQDNFTVPVMSVWINNINSTSLPSPWPLTVTCKVPISYLNNATFRNVTLSRIYEFPKDVVFTVNSPLINGP